jgi:hypothetical protein
MKTIKLLLINLLTLPFCFSQNSYDVEEGKPFVMNGIEYGYEIRNESKKGIKKEEYNKFEVRAFVTNKSGCTKIMFPRQTLLLGLDYQDVMAEFDCINATGKRLTSKSAKVKAREFTAPYSYTTRDANGKDFKNNVYVKVGNMLKNGETIYNNFTVILQDGERPNIRVRIIETNE